jgi:hypothetical protein
MMPDYFLPTFSATASLYRFNIDIAKNYDDSWKKIMATTSICALVLVYNETYIQYENYAKDVVGIEEHLRQHHPNATIVHPSYLLISPG